MNAITYQFGLTRAKRKKLIFPLIITEIIGILVLIWFLRIPLYQKYLAVQPNNYAIDSLDPDRQYLMKQGDFISGTTTAGTTLQIWLAPDGLKHGITPDYEGNFSFQIPTETIPDSYQLIIASDRNGEIGAIKVLKVRIESNGKFNQALNSLNH